MKSNLEGFDLPRFAELDAEYEIVRELGRGGTAVVYLARERELGRNVAIKVIRATYIEDEEAAARLEREARTIASLQHPNIVMLHGTRRLRDKSLALIMQYVHGRTLKSEVLASGPLPFERVEQILTDLGRALTCAQHHRIVHRDIKPENVYIDRWTGSAKLSDFGIARPWDSEQGLTLPGIAIGTPAYMSPEQIDGTVLDGRSDLYSLGLVGYEMLTGQAPWAGEGLFNMIYKQKHEALPPLAELRPGIPIMLRRALEGALHKNREDRWADAAQFLEALTGRLESPLPPISDVSAAEHVLPDTPAHIASPTIQYRRPEAAAPDQDPEDPIPAEVVPYVEDEALVEEPSEPFKLSDYIDPAEIESAAMPRARPKRGALFATVGAAVLLATALAVFAKQGAEPSAGIALRAEAESPPPSAPSEPALKAAADQVPVLAWKRQGDRQVGAPGDTLPLPLLLKVEDSAGRGVPGVSVTFAVTAGDGAVAPPSTVTDESGIAEARWLLGPASAQAVTATVPQMNSQKIEFTARSQPRPAAGIAQVSPSELRGAPGQSLGSPLVVKVTDSKGKPVFGVPVAFSIRSGQGQISPAQATTAADGTARAEWVLGPGGAQEASAALPDLPSARVAFRATLSQPAAVAVRRAVTVGGTHTCLLNSEGEADCWGGNDKGQLGDGSAGRRTGSVRVAAPEQLTALSAGVSHTCGVGASGAVFCWGTNTAGQLGDGTRADRVQPVKLAFETPISRVFSGMSHSCALDSGGKLFCWGENTHGQLGDGSRTDRAAPVSAGRARTFRAVALGWAHTCALTADGSAYCWGRNTSGELGDGSTIGRPEPTAVSGGARFSAIAAGSAHTCGLTLTGTVMCWGQNSFGQLGNNSTNNSAVPVVVEPTDFFAGITVGSVHSCALTRDGSARCWGRNTYGQIGDGSTENRSWPTPVAGGHRFNSLHASAAHTCGTAGGTTLCWGYNSEGQLGNGTRTNQTRPVAVNRP